MVLFKGIDNHVSFVPLLNILWERGGVVLSLLHARLRVQRWKVDVIKMFFQISLPHGGIFPWLNVDAPYGALMSIYD